MGVLSHGTVKTVDIARILWRAQRARRSSCQPVCRYPCAQAKHGEPTVIALEEWGVPLTVLGMVLLTLTVAALHHRYLAYLTEVRIAVSRLEANLIEITTALDDLTRIPLSRELRLTLRSDVLARYQRIRSLYRRYPGIVEKIRMAEQALDAVGPPTASGVAPLEDQRVFRSILVALNHLNAVVCRGGTLRPIPGDVRRIFQREIAERRAEVMSRYHLVEARRHDAQGNSTKARTHLLTLLQALRHHGPVTPFTRELATEANAALSRLGNQDLIAETAAVDVKAV